MQTCHACGASISAAAEWCGQCYALPGRASPSGSVSMPSASTSAAPSVMATHQLAGPSIMAATRGVPTLAPTMVKTRWRKTGTTFGPVGRLLATVALVVPFLVFVVVGIFTGGLTIAGAVIWGFVIMPWGLRDTWKAGQIPAR
jgi:hypothetical protein